MSEQFMDPNVVKVVCDERGHALSFSRAPIPWPRDAFSRDRRARCRRACRALRHIGLNAYTVCYLRRHGGLPTTAAGALRVRLSNCAPLGMGL
jgi:3-deoxy-manno-octulosonate cytidylyltransferase (CMP-KDO synthetase)